MAALGQLALDGIDPRLPKEGAFNYNGPSTLVTNAKVTFEEYIYYASITRAEEKVEQERLTLLAEKKTIKSILKNRFSKEIASAVVSASNDIGHDLKSPDGEVEVKKVVEITDAEWKTASRSIRTAGWSSIFFLITTDILGPYSVPWAIAQMGYGPGIALYTVFGALAAYGGWWIYKVFVSLDSDRYPMHSFGEAFYRIFGAWAKHLINMLLAFQLLCVVAVLTLWNGQAISQISQGTICFVVCLIIFMAAGLIVAQIRTLVRFSWLANFAVWINILVLCICMGVAAHSPPNFDATEASFGPDFAEGPIYKFAGTPPDGMASGGIGFSASLNGLNQAIFSYGGSVLFISFLAEMRHPWDFWKALLCSQLLIYSFYLFFGLFIYSYQGQYTFNPAMQGLSPYVWQTTANAMNLVSALIACGLYSNIGIKIVYIEFIQETVGGPRLNTKRGSLIWAAMVPIYWILAFVICAAVPQFSYVSGLVSAIGTLQFTYTFPAIMAVFYQAKIDATVEGEFDPVTGVTTYVDTGLKRFIRGYKKKWILNTWNAFYFLGTLVLTALGIYSSIIGIIGAFEGKSIATSFGCTAPV